MAIPKTRVTLSILDSEGYTSPITIYSNREVSAVQGDLSRLRSLFGAVTGGTVTHVEVTGQDPYPTSLKPAGQADNEMAAYLSLPTQDRTKAGFFVPAFSRALLLPGSSDIDPEASEVLDLVEFVTQHFIDSRGTSFVQVQSGNNLLASPHLGSHFGKESYRRRRSTRGRGRNKSSAAVASPEFKVYLSFPVTLAVGSAFHPVIGFIADQVIDVQWRVGVETVDPLEAWSFTSTVKVDLASIYEMDLEVARLDFSDSGIEGSIPAKFSHYSNLIELDLSGNKFKGRAPVRLSNLKNIERIDLSFNPELELEPLIRRIFRDRFTFNKYPILEIEGTVPITDSEVLDMINQLINDPLGEGFNTWRINQ